MMEQPTSGQNSRRTTSGEQKCFVEEGEQMRWWTLGGAL